VKALPVANPTSETRLTQTAVAQIKLQVGGVEGGPELLPLASILVHQHADAEGDGEHDGQKGGGGVG